MGVHYVWVFQCGGGGALSLCICVGVTVFSTCVFQCVHVCDGVHFIVYASELHGVHCTDEPQKGETVTVLTVCSSLDHIIYV